MYESFYHLKAKPFQLVPNPGLLYRNPKHENALTYLEYGLREKLPFILLTGEIGTGKTTLVRYLLNAVEDQLDIALIFNTKVTSEELLNLILQEFELPAHEESKAKALDELYHFLIGRYARHRGVLLVIDEAQNLPDEALEDLRMLSNLQSDEHILLQILLVGQPELKDKLNTNPRLTQLTQRISVSYHLLALNRAETGEYIKYRLQEMGGSPTLFSEDAIDLIFTHSAGVPRTINLLSDSALVYGYADELTVITGDVVQLVLDDRGGMSLGVGSEDDRGKVEPPPALPMTAMIAERLDTIDKAIMELGRKLDCLLNKDSSPLPRPALDNPGPADDQGRDI